MSGRLRATHCFGVCHSRIIFVLVVLFLNLGYIPINRYTFVVLGTVCVWLVYATNGWRVEFAVSNAYCGAIELPRKVSDQA